LRITGDRGVTLKSEEKIGSGGRDRTADPGSYESPSRQKPKSLLLIR